MDYLLLVSLGPIQDFIASARRCQDLWFGSWMLSDLARMVATTIRAAGGNTLVFPAALGNDKVAVANKILAVLGKGGDPSTIAESGRIALQERIVKLADRAFRNLRAPVGEAPGDPGFRHELAYAQLSDLMEYVWVAVPMESGGYADARDRAEALLASRKNTRTWGAVTTGVAGLPKSSLDGLRESVLTEHLKKLSPERRRVKYGVKGSEQLCGVGLLKRLGCEMLLEDAADDGDLFHDGKRPVFHSTSHMAAGPLLTRIARRGPAARAALATYLRVLRDDRHLRIGQRFHIGTGDVATAAEVRHPWDDTAPAPNPPRAFPFDRRGYDGVLLFESRLDDIITQSIDLPSDESAAELQVRAIRDAVAPALRALLGALDVRVSPGRPTPYYALLLGDGDHMGSAIDLVARRAEGDPLENHRRLGKHLDEFALGCRERVEAHGGSLLYAGGDDVLALLPLHTALRCARALKESFDAAMARTKLFPIDDDDRIPVTPTLSVGLAIAHHLDAMADARELAKHAEGIAKHDAGRNALAIVASKRSGGTITAFSKWDVSPGLPLDWRLAEWGRHLASGALPDGVAWALEEAMAPFETGDDGATPDVVSRLVERVFARRRDASQQQLGADVKELLDAALAAHGATVQGVLRISEEIQLARVFLSAWDDAWEVCS